jgi:hypothetical protein
MVDRPMPIVNNCIHGGFRNRFPRLKMFLNRHRGNTNDGTSSNQFLSSDSGTWTPLGSNEQRCRQSSQTTGLENGATNNSRTKDGHF